MKLKYYLRGAGVGIIISTFIFSISLLFYQPSVSESEIKKEAEKLGMVLPEEESQDDKTKEDVPQEENRTTDDTTNAETKETNEGEGVSLMVQSGDSSATVSAHLQEMGLVDDSNAFDSFLSQQDLDNLILPGEYVIPKGSTYLEIAEILTTKK